MALEQPGVAVRFPNRPGANDAGVGPARAEGLAAAAVRHRIGRVVGIGAEAALRLVHVVDPLGEKRGDIGVETRGAHVGLRVAHPAEALVALRAIRGDLDEVGALRPLGVAGELREHRVAALEPARERRIVVQHEAGDGVGRGFLGESGEFDVLKAVIRETRRPRLARPRRRASCRYRSRAPCGGFPS